MIKVAICDDEPIFVEQIYRFAKEFLDQRAIPFQADLFASGEEVIQALEKEIEYDIAFLDIKMSRISGVDLGVLLRQKFQNTKTLLIYISAYDSRAKDVFHINAIRFLSKPIEQHLFEEALSYAYQLLEKQKNQIFTFKKDSQKEIILSLSDIFYFETEANHRIGVITTSKPYIGYGKMADIESQFSESDFLRIHQGYFINFDHIAEINYKEVLMKNNITLPISRERRKEIRRQYMQIRKRRELSWL